MKATDTGKLQEIRDNGWNIYSCPRAERGGGGIGILFRDGLVLKQCPVKTRYKSFQVQEVLISDRDQPKRLCNVYRPPYTTKSRLTEAFFLSEFSDYLSEVMMKQGTPIIAGDLNFQIQDKNNFYSRKLLDLLDSFDLKQRVPLQPTHQHGGTLDLGITPRDLNTGNMTIFPDGTTSDHFLVQFELSVKPDLANSCAKKSLFREYRDYKSMDVEGFKGDLRECDPDKLIGRDSEETIINIYRWLESLVEKWVPKKRLVNCSEFLTVAASVKLCCPCRIWAGYNDYLSEVMMKQGTPIIAGDLNFQIQDKNNFYSRKLLDLLDSFDLKQRVPLQPTHQHGGTLDLVITPRDLNTGIGNMTIFPDGTTSDHFLVQFELSVKPDLANSCAKKRNKALIALMFRYLHLPNKGDLRECDPDKLIGRDSEETIINIYRWLESLVEKWVPKKRVRGGKKIKPWRDEELRSLLRERRKAERYWRKHGTMAAKSMFNELKRKFGSMDKEKRALFIKEDLDTVKDDPRALQRKLQRLLGKTETILPETTNSKKLADSFSQFFNSKVTKIRKFVKEEQKKYEDSEEHLKYEESEDHLKYEEPEDHLEYEESEEYRKYEDYEESGTEDSRPSWTDFAIVSEEEIIPVIKSMSNKHCDLDPLPTSVVKECVRELAPVLTAMVNQSLQKSSVAKTLQKALVFPTIKNPYGDREALTNYRPVSNIPFLSKLLEKVVLGQLNDYVQCHSLLGKHQSGYRAGHSCETLLVSMFDDLLGEMDKGNVVALICLDMSAAFDTVDHEGLLKVLQQRFGVDGVPLQWFKSYLSSRSFSVSVQDCLSETLELLCGVPQGSLLGPVLFLLYIEAMQDIVKPYGLRIKVYADDSQLYVSLVPTDPIGWTRTKADIEECLAKLKKWMVEQWLKCNEAKTEFILVGKTSSISKLSSDPDLVTPDLVTPRIFYFKRFFSTQCWLCECIYILPLGYTALMVRQFTVQFQLYCSDTVEYGRYISSKHSGVNPKELSRLSSMRYGRHCVSAPCLLAYKIVSGTAPEYLQDLVPLDDCWGASRTTRMTGVLDPYRLKHPQMSSINANSKLRRRRISVFLPTVWNDLPFQIRSIPNVDTFKSRLKTHLFTVAFGEVPTVLV
eukprot:sb/3461335/